MHFPQSGNCMAYVVTLMWLRQDRSFLGSSPGDVWKRNQFPRSSSLFTRPSKNSYDYSDTENLGLLIFLIICRQVWECPGNIPIYSLPCFDYRENVL